MTSYIQTKVLKRQKTVTLTTPSQLITFKPTKQDNIRAHTHKIIYQTEDIWCKSVLTSAPFQNPVW